jgi:hypothetical protein
MNTQQAHTLKFFFLLFTWIPFFYLTFYFLCLLLYYILNLLKCDIKIIVKQKIINLNK